jgi:cell division protein FtsI/penicillin-binding protein 2
MRHPGHAAITLVIGLTLGIGLLTGCTAKPPGPQVNASAFLADWGRRDWAGMRALASNPPADFTSMNQMVLTDMGVTQLSVTGGAVASSGSTATEPVTERLTLGSGLGTINLSSTLHLTQDQMGKWWVNWTPATISPQLSTGDHLKMDATWPDRAAILDANGNPLTTQGQSTTIGVEGARIKDPAAVSSALVAAGATKAEVTAALAAAKTHPTFFEPVFTVSATRYEQLKPTIYPIPGTVFHTGTQRHASTPGLATGVVGVTGPVTAQELTELGAPYTARNVVGQSGLEWGKEKQLAGTPTVDIDVVSAAGTVTGTLTHINGQPGMPLQTTINLSVQQAAEAALAGEKKTAALVAVNATNGHILAAATVNSGFDDAMAGGFPPGSTFKIIDSTALFEKGLTPSSAASCPSTITEDGELFHNAEGDGPVSTMLQAFTESCNTAFIGLVSNNLTRQVLAAAAKTLGLGKKVHIGTLSYLGQVPVPVDGADLAATSIGQGKVLASPLSMAMVAAAADTGMVRQPVLLTGPGAATVAAPTQLPASVVSGLHTMMASVVVSGTAAGTGLPSGTYAKTGTAEIGENKPFKLDAWLVGFRGDVAFACLVVDSPGDGGPTCGPLVAKFLDSIGNI